MVNQQHEIANEIINWAEEKKAEKIMKIDVTQKSDFADIMIICEGLNELHLRAIADNIKDKSKLEELNLMAVEGYDNASWILMDFGDIIVHIFKHDTRKYYQLEQLWNVNAKNKPKLEQSND